MSNPHQAQQWIRPQHNELGLVALLVGSFAITLAVVVLVMSQVPESDNGIIGGVVTTAVGIGLLVAWPPSILAGVFGGLGVVMACRRRASTFVAITAASTAVVALVLSVVATVFVLEDSSETDRSGPAVGTSGSGKKTAKNKQNHDKGEKSDGGSGAVKNKGVGLNHTFPLGAGVTIKITALLTYLWVFERA